MARYPNAIWRPVERFNPGGSIAQRITSRRFVFHTAVSNSPTLWPYFNQSGNPCSHFYVNETGVIEQYVDTGWRAPANLEGNHDCISIESWDGAQSPIPPWNPAQVAALRKLVAWVSATHGIPRSILPSSKTGLTGFGWHRQGIDPWRLPGTEYWSKSTGKICPGDAKIAQVPSIVTSGSGEEPDMTPEEHEWLRRLDIAFNDGTATPFTARAEVTDRVRSIDARLVNVENAVRLQANDETNILVAIEAAKIDPAALAAALAPLLPPGVALTPDDVAAIAAAAAVTVNDELAARTSPPA